MVSDSVKRRWEQLKSLLVIGSLVVAALAYHQSQAATKQAQDVAKKQADMSDHAVFLQEQSLDRQKAMVDIKDVQIFLQGYDNVPEKLYPAQVPTNKFEPVPIDEWRAHPHRYVDFTIANPGTLTIHVNRVGLGTNERAWKAADEGSFWCFDKSNRWTNPCSGEIPAATEVRYSFEISDEMLQGIDDSWDSKSFELCVKIQAYNEYCLRTTTTALPAGFKPSQAPGHP